MHKRKAEQERRAQQGARRAEEILSAFSSRMRKAERAALETLCRVEVLPWRIESGSLRPRRPCSLPGRGGACLPHQRARLLNARGLLFLPLFP